MSKPREWWWPAAKAMIRAYPKLHQELEEMKEQSLTARATGLPRARRISRQTESLAIKELPAEQQHAHDAVAKALEITRQMPEGEIRLEIIKRVIWEKRCTVAGASYQLHVGEATGWRYHGDFIRLVGRCYGFMN